MVWYKAFLGSRKVTESGRSLLIDTELANFVFHGSIYVNQVTLVEANLNYAVALIRSVPQTKLCFSKVFVLRMVICGY